MHLTSHITHSNGYAPCIAYYRSNGVDQLFRKLKPKPKLNPPNAHRSPIKICEKWHTHNVQFPFMPNAFRILKPIQKSSKPVWVFHNTGANAFAKNQMRLAYEDKRDLYCMPIPANYYNYCDSRSCILNIGSIKVISSYEFLNIFLREMLYLYVYFVLRGLFWYIFSGRSLGAYRPGYYGGSVWARSVTG